MIKAIPLFLSLLLVSEAFAQTAISGAVTDPAGGALPGANIYLKDTYDGATSDAAGQFRFETSETGQQTIIVSFVGFETAEKIIEITVAQEVNFTLKEAFNSLEAVSISAGTFEASDEKKVVVLQSLDIATTAGATADITGALNTLPGTQKVGESGRLFVRGGTSEETRIYIDGAEAANYYGASTNAIPTRSRFSPFLFKGTFFSTGGYSAEYGQALSSALILNTTDAEPQSKAEVSLMSVGVDAALTKAWDGESLHARIGYYNLNPYNNLISQRIEWIRGSTSWDGLLTYKKHFTNGGRLKVLGMVNTGTFALREATILNPQGYNETALQNSNLFGTANLEVPVGEKDFFYVGVSNSRNVNKLTFNETSVRQPTNNHHFKTKFVHEFSPKSVLNTGVELLHEWYEETLTDQTLNLQMNYRAFVTAGYAELDQYLSEAWMIRAGARVEHLDLSGQTTLSPRISMARKLNEFSQVSLASGLFYQRPESQYLRISDELKQEQASHYILNYQWIRDHRVFRAEAYHKKYDDLVTFTNLFDPESFKNDGQGYASGLDVFWRDRGTVKNLDYWVSYSWMKSERLFRDFPEKAAPGFSSAHNFSFVLKRWFPVLRSQMGATYSFTSGRPYENPNLDGFNESQTRSYHDLSYNVAFLPRPNLIIYLSATNLLGIDQVFGYRYTPAPDSAGVYASEAIRLPAKRFIFLGCFLTIGAFNNQLDNL